MKKGNLKVIIATLLIAWILSCLFAVRNAKAKGIDCNRNPIYCQIKKNSPRLNSKKAYHLSNVIHKAALKHRIPTRIFVAILAQESGYSLKAKGCHRGLREETIEEVEHRCNALQSSKGECLANGRLYPKKIETRICSDFGIGQIYFKTAKGFGFDIGRLTVDLEYSIDAAAIVLADFQKRYSARETHWWLRYNCGGRGTTKRDTCQIYKKLVERYF